MSTAISPPPPSRAARPQLSPDELQQLRWLLGGVLTLLAVATVGYVDVSAGWLMALTAAASLATTWRPTLPSRVPRWVHVMAFPLIAAFFALDLWLRSELLPAMVRLDMLLLLYRALVYRQRRDDLQVIVLGLFLIVVAGVLTVSVLFAAHILLYTACALFFLLVLTLLESGRPAVAAPAAAGPGIAPAWATHVSWRRLFARVVRALDWRVALVGAGMFAGVIAATALLFLVIPRFQLGGGMFLDRFISKKARTGFTDTIKFGDVTDIQQDTSVALYVDVSDPGLIPLEPYWRMLVLNQYSNGTFRMSPALRVRRFEPRPHTGVVVYGNPSPRRNTGVWRVYFQPGVSRYLPLLGGYWRLIFAEAQTYRTADTLGLLALTKDPVAMTAYQVEGFDLGAPLRDPPEGFYSQVLSPRDDADAATDMARLRRIDAAVTGGRDLPTAEFASRVCGWLRAEHPYSLSPRIPAGAGDPLVRWVDSRAAGHCELFAGAFVLLARTAGFPARVVTGFRGGSWNAFSKSFTVRNSDAHAWAEIYDRASGAWLRADPLETPQAEAAGTGGAAALAERTDRSWSARLDSLRVFWYRRVVSFDQQAQVRTLKVAKELAQAALARWRQRLDRGAHAITAWLRKPWDVRRVAGFGVVLALAAGLTWGWHRLRLWAWRCLSRRRGGRRQDPVRREAGRWLRRFEASAGRDPVRAELERLRFGPRASWPEAAAVFRRARHARRRRAQ